MKKICLLIFATGQFVLFACNNASKHNPDTSRKLQNREDSLYNDVIEAHDVAMRLMGKMKGYRDQVIKQLDSINQLPEPEKARSVEYMELLKSLGDSLSYADMAMDTWMTEFVPDSAENNPALRLSYLESEKIKATRMKEHVVNAVELSKQLLKN